MSIDTITNLLGDAIKDPDCNRRNVGCGQCQDHGRIAAAPRFRRAIVPVDSIIVEETLGRELDDEHVQTLAEIIEHFGNRYPPTVSEDMRLLTGQPQLAAVQRLGRRTVEVIIEMTP
jgi:hypothetical protein